MNRQAIQDNPLGWQPIPKLLFKFALPAVISMLVNSIYNIVDQIFIGKYVGYLGNAATTVVFPLVTISMALALLIGNGNSANINIRLGEGKKEEAGRFLGTAVTSLAAVSVLYGALVLVFLPNLVQLFGASGSNLPYALEYGGIVAIGYPFVMFSTGMASYIQADGNPLYAMTSNLFGAILNIGLDALFVIPLGMGVAGAAIATVISQFLSFCLCVLYLAKFSRRVFLRRINLIPDPCTLWKITSLGVSSFATQSAITIVQIVCNRSLVHYSSMTVFGEGIALSAMGIVMKVNSILVSIIVGIASGSAPILGYNRGKQQYGRIRRTYLTAVSIGVCISTTAWAVFHFFPHVLASFFGDTSGYYGEFIINCFRIYLGASFCIGFQIISANYFQAVGQPLKALLLSMSRQLVFLVTFMLTFPVFFGLIGVLYAGPAADLLSAVITGTFMFLEMRKLSRLDLSPSLSTQNHLPPDPSL